MALCENISSHRSLASVVEITIPETGAYYKLDGNIDRFTGETCHGKYEISGHAGWFFIEGDVELTIKKHFVTDFDYVRSNWFWTSVLDEHGAKRAVPVRICLKDLTDKHLMAIIDHFNEVPIELLKEADYRGI